MKTIVFLCFILLLTITQEQALQLFSVSSTPISVKNPSGSVAGGTTIYIRGLGFSTNAADNQVFVGNYPCQISADGATQTTLACITSDSRQYGNLNNLPITVISNQEQQVLGSGSFSYTFGTTPVITNIYPSTSVPGTFLRFQGVHRIQWLGDGKRDMGDIISMKIGEDQCGRFDLVEGPISANSNDKVSCRQAPEQEAGKHYPLEHNIKGKSIPDYFLRRTSFLNEKFYFAVLPDVQLVSPKIGTYLGNRLTITGGGFSTNSSVINVSVNGTTCDVVNSSLKEIICELRQKKITDDARIPTNSGGQSNGFFSGKGLRYRRYRIDSLINKSPDGLRQAVNSNSGQISKLQDSFRGEIEAGPYYGQYYGQAYTGYFTAPVDGRYEFSGVADDSFAVYLSSGVYGSTQHGSALIYSNSPQDRNFFISNHRTAIANVTLQVGKSYHIEVYHLNLDGQGHMRVAVSVPNVDRSLQWQTHTAHKMRLSFTNDPEIVQFNQTGGTEGRINMTIVTREEGKPPTVQFTVIDFDASISQFLTALRKLDQFAHYDISGWRQMYDQNDTLTNNPDQAYTYSWFVSIWLVRPTEASNVQWTPEFIDYNGTQSFTYAVIHPHGPLINGRFTLSIGGINIGSFDAGVSADSLQSRIRSIAGFGRTQVQIISDPWWQSYGATWVITYFGVNLEIPDFTIDDSSLYGGKVNTKPMVRSWTLRYYTPSLLFDPIDYTLLNTASDQPNVLVTVNNMPSVCTGDCKYSFLTNTPELLASSISGQIVTLSLNDPGSLGYSLIDVNVSVGGQECLIVDVSALIGNFQCQLPVNNDSSPVVPAGSYIPKVKVAQVGLIAPVVSVATFNFPMVISSLDITSGSYYGGYTMNIQGAGFPLTIYDATVTMCGVSATILSITNTQASILVPQCFISTQTVTIFSSTQTSNKLSFDYINGPPPAFIYSISPNSYNPSMKGIMNITGSGFGLNMLEIRVDLANSSGKIYPLRILAMNDSFIKVGIPGGLTGDYKVEVNKQGIGQAYPSPTSANNFKYELVITSIYPNNGSYHGGTLVHIEGINFSPGKDQTLVYIGNQLNWWCIVQQLNSTDILCRTPKASPYYNTSNPQKVYVEVRLMVQNTCGSIDACQFYYLNETDSPSLNSLSTNSIAAGSVTLRGSQLNISLPQVAITNKYSGITTVIQVDDFDEDFITFTIPRVQSGQYSLRARFDPIGESNSKTINIKSVLWSANPLSMSTNGGIVQLNGFGMPESWPHNKYRLKVTSGNSVVQARVVGTEPSKMSIKLPGAANGVKYKISLVPPHGSTLTAIVTFTASITPTLVLTSSTLTIPGDNSFIFTKKNVLTSNPAYVEVYSLYNKKQLYNVTSLIQGIDTVSFKCFLPGGRFGFRFYYVDFGYASCAEDVRIIISQPSVAPFVASYNGGTFDIVADGLSPSGTLNFGGFETTLESVTNTSAVGLIPKFIHFLTQSAYSLTQPYTLNRKHYSLFSDNQTSQPFAFDSIYGTIYSSSNTDCHIGIDVGSQVLLNLTRVRFFPNSRWFIAADYLIGATFEASFDGVNYDVIATVDSTVHSGWNLLPFTLSTLYRYIKFSHTSTSKCQLSQLQIQGILVSKASISSLTSNTMNIVYQDGANTFTFTNVIQYREDHTPIIEKLSRTTGDVFGGYNLTLTGQYLDFDQPSVLIDGQYCTILQFNSTQITCNVSHRFQLPSHNSFIVKIGGNNAVLHQIFRYVLRWSDIRTWGTDMPPIDGDIVLVPSGMNLYVDQSTPQLVGILVENGTLTFADESDMTIKAEFITIIGGKFIAGTEKKPYQHKLTFIMSGGYYSAQLPVFGNKVIGCHECFFSMHGQIRNHTWTQLETTINGGGSILEVQDPVDWQIGQQIVVASSSFNHHQAQKRTITAINGTTLTVNRPFNHRHYAGIDHYSSDDKLQMRAEVGLLTRNIKIMGDETSVQQSYGSHLLLAGSSENGLVGHIAYSQFTDCGQPRIIGRYCIHFHMNGDVHESYVRGNAVHESMARVVTLHGVHFLTVEHNVGYRVKGHNIFVEDGIETNNLIQYNLLISSLQVWTMLQTDISVASYWITHPSNTVRYNHAAGSDFYGFWYEIKPRPDGPSARGDICPMGSPLGQVHHNVAHSNARFGLRIFKLCPRKYPCRGLYTKDQYRPWKVNEPIYGIFHNFVLFKNGECGLLAEQTGHLIFTNFTCAENKRAGAEFYVSEFTEKPVEIRNSAMIGITTGNPQGSSTIGIVTPGSGNIRIDNIRFYNFGGGTRSLQTCSGCIKPAEGNQIYISNITYTNVTGSKLFMGGHKRQILYDLDGTFTSTEYDGTQRSSAAIVKNWKHLSSEPACKRPTNSGWDNTLACDQTAKVILVTIKSLSPSGTFDSVHMKIQQVPDVYYNVSETSTNYQTLAPKVYSAPYVTGRLYQLWWHTGLDFKSFELTSSNYMDQLDDGILFKFNYTLDRQAYDVGASRPHRPIRWDNLYYPTYHILDETNCSNGDYYHDDTVGNRTFQICASAKNRTYFETVKAVAIPCRYLCPLPPNVTALDKEDFVRYWSNLTQWPDGRLHLPGEDVYVNWTWTIIMDIDPAPCGIMQIDGDVIIQDKDSRNITCDSIWIRLGSLSAGTSTQPFMNNLTIQLNGQKRDPGYTFDIGLQGSKIMVVTGRLELYGYGPTNTMSRLTKSVFRGDTELTVESADGWSVNDTLVIAPSFSSAAQYERVTITDINGSSVTFFPPLRFAHYGSSKLTISNSIGDLDTRALVGHVTRTIKFVSGPDEGWGYQIWVYQMWKKYNSYTGNAIFSAVQFTMGGQYDTENAVLNMYNNGDSSSGRTTVTRSSFSFCRSYCVYAFGHKKALFQHNVFYEGRKFHLKFTSIRQFIVHSNLFIGAISRPTFRKSEPVACLQLLNAGASAGILSLKHNICQGSAVNGFVLPLLTCGQLNSNPFANNTVGSAQHNGFLLISGRPAGCVGFSGVKAYACGTGQIANPAGVGAIKYTKFILADNRLGLSLRFGSGGVDSTAIVQESYFTAVSRPDCSECYGATACRGLQAIRLPAITVNGEHYPGVFSHFDAICKNQVFDSKAYIRNVVFQNYRSSYVEPSITGCGGNFLFKPHGNAPDVVGSVYTWNTFCNYCDFNAIGRFDPPKKSQLGWFGGCGKMVCTGRQNYIIEDHTGDLFNQTGVILASNREIGDSSPECTYNPKWNGHFCTVNHKFAVLQYESIAPDKSTRIMWPVSLKYDGGNWQTFTNGFKEWDWAGRQPLNHRLARFISTVRLHQYYNMSFASNPPDDMRFQIQKRISGGNSSDWIVVRVYYPFPNMIQIQVGGKVVRPISLLDNNGQQPVNTSICGSNKFYYFNRTIEFVITGANDCLVRMSLTDSVQLTLHFAMKLADFYRKDGKTRIIDRICALFMIKDQSRVKVVSIYTGSVEVTLMINAPLVPENQSLSADFAASRVSAKQMQKMVNAAIEGKQLGDELMSKDGIGPLISAATTLIPMHPQGQNSPEEINEDGFIIGIGVAIAIAVIIGVILFIWLKRRSRKVRNIIPTESNSIVVRNESPDKTLEIKNETQQNISDLDIDKEY